MDERMLAKAKEIQPREDQVYAAAWALVRRAKDTQAIEEIGFRLAMAPYLDALEKALPPRNLSWRDVRDALNG